MMENNSRMEGLMRDNHVFNQRMQEEESIQHDMRAQISQLRQDNDNFLDQIAIIKREKDVEISRMIHEFKLEKEALITKAKRDKEQNEADFKAEVAKQEREKNDQRTKAVDKRLEIEKKLEEDTEKFKN